MTQAVDELLAPVLDANPSLADQREQVRRMLAALKSGGVLEGMTVARMSCRDGSPDRVNLLTMHSFKGCEYDVVIMVGLDQGVFPWSNENAASISEGRRLFYVGLTRAKDEVHMLYSGWYERRGQRCVLGPSMFLVELAHRMQSQSEA